MVSGVVRAPVHGPRTTEIRRHIYAAFLRRFARTAGIDFKWAQLFPAEELTQADVGAATFAPPAHLGHELGDAVGQLAHGHGL